MDEASQPSLPYWTHRYTHIQTDRQRGIQTDRQTDRQTYRPDQNNNVKICKDFGQLLCLLNFILSLQSMSYSRGHLNELTSYVDLSKARCLHISRPRLSGRRSSLTVLNQVCLWSTGSASPVFGRTPNAGHKSSRMVLTSVGTTKMDKERQAPSTDSIWLEWLIRTRPNHVIGDKIRPVLMENTSEAPTVQLLCLWNFITGT